MICNVIDRRSRPYRWKRVNAVIEAVAHDNSCRDADQTGEASPHDVLDHDHRDGLCVHDAIAWANDQRCPVTLYIYDCGEREDTRRAHFEATESRFERR
jgi:hypothetical protein